MPTITPYDILNANNPDPDVDITTGGTWTYTGTGSTGAAPLPPNAPGAYNGTLAFTSSVANGTYEYTYTVTSGGCSHAIPLEIVFSDYTLVPNDDCSTAKNTAFPYGGGCSEWIGERLAGECPGQDDPTYDGTIATPTGWGAATYDADLWYKFSYDPTNNPGGIAPNAMAISVDGSAYGTEGIRNPVIALYSACAAGSIEDTAVAVGNSQLVTLVVGDVFASSFTYYVRVSAPDGFEGKFDISVTT